MSAQEPSGRDSARAVCAALHHSYRSLRMYPPGHPTPEQAFQTLVDALTLHLDQFGPLELEVQETQLVYEDEDVYSFPGSRDNLAFILFRDGIRTVSLLPGMEARELRALVDCLAQAETLADLEHDLATALWEQDLPHFEYEVVDPFISGELDLLEGVLGELGETAAARQAGAAAALAVGETEPTTVPADRADWQPEDLASVEEAPDGNQPSGEIMEQTTSEVYADFAEVLLEIVGSNDEETKGDDRLTSSLAAALGELLSLGELDKVELAVDRLEMLEKEGCQPAGYVGQVVARALTPGRVALLTSYALQEAGTRGERARRLLEKLRVWIYPALLEVLSEAEDKSVRRLILNVLMSGQGVPAVYLEPLFRDKRWYVVRNAVHLAVELQNHALLPHFERLLSHSDPRVRREVVRGLSALGGSKAASLLATALRDDDAGVRTLAARGLARHGGREHYPIVLEQATAKSLDTRSPEEVEEILVALARLGGETAVQVLDKLWKRRLFGTRPLAVRTAAVRALALIPGQSARRSLEAARRCGEAVIEQAATQALSDLYALGSSKPSDAGKDNAGVSGGRDDRSGWDGPGSE
ncbi:MAG: HEAT repeat domain-containing protein [Thermoleophilia bacterium]|nr:HEAT repeat domain-containing protein [Thermoleophilia bacterium]